MNFIKFTLKVNHSPTVLQCMCAAYLFARLKQKRKR